MTLFSEVQECLNCKHAIAKVRRRDFDYWIHLDITLDGEGKTQRDCYGHMPPQATPKVL